MRKPEQRLWDTMRRNNVHHFWLQRMECALSLGVPDVVVGGSVWVELKAPKRPARATTALLHEYGLSVDQINWHLKAAAIGARSYILIRDDRHELFLISGDFAKDINGYNVQDMRIRSWASTWPSIWSRIEHGQVETYG